MSRRFSRRYVWPGQARSVSQGLKFLTTVLLMVVFSFLTASYFQIRVNLEVGVFCNETLTLQCNGSTSLPSAAVGGPSDTFLWWTITRRTCIAVYAAITVTTVVTVFVRCSLFVRFFINVSTNLHNDMFNAMIRATMLFFNTNSSGNSHSIGYHANTTLFNSLVVSDVDDINRSIETIFF